MTRSDVYKTLPAVFTTWFSLILMSALRNQQGGKHNEREARTIVEVCDALLEGDTVLAFMLLLGRLRAITSVVIPEGSQGGWAVAQQYEILRTSNSGLLSARDRDNAQRDHRDALRAAGASRTGPLAPRP